MPASARSLLPELGSDPVAAVRAGLPIAALDRLQSHLQVSDARLAPLLGVSPRTLRRRRTAGTLTPDASDRLVLLAEVVALAQQALDGPDPARKWLRAPHSLLGGEPPLDRMDTVVGMNEVKTMLSHVEYGMPV
jgi:putative toxin-antitoxin system antitoxin component (TIGR02293 family)